MGIEKPKLPTGDDMYEFCPATHEWFETWRQNPCTDGWDDRHWQYLFDTAVVHTAVYDSRDYAMLGELDKRERYMGLSFSQGAVKSPETKKKTVLQIVQEDRENRHAGAANQNRA